MGASMFHDPHTHAAGDPGRRRPPGSVRAGERQEKLTGELSRVTRSTKRLVEVFTQSDRVPADLKGECLELDERKQRVQAELEKVQIEISRTAQRALDLGIIQRSLQDFAQLVAALPVEEQKELMQLLIDQVVVSPWDPENEETPSEEGVFTARIRTKHYKVNLRMHQIPDLAGSVNPSARGSDNEAIGSPPRTTFATFASG